MKNKKLLNIIGGISDEYISEAAPKTNRRKIRLAIGATAACLCLVIVGTIGIMQGTMGNPDFIIENGTLLSYSGTDESIVVPKSVTSISKDAFSGAGNLQVVTLSASVSSIDHNAFRNCYTLTRLNVDPKNESFVENDGLVMSADGRFLVRYQREGERSYTIPESVRFIGAGAFSGAQLDNLDLPGHLIYIGEGCFENSSISLSTYKEPYYGSGDFLALSYSATGDQTMTHYSFHSDELYGFMGHAAQDYANYSDMVWVVSTPEGESTPIDSLEVTRFRASGADYHSVILPLDQSGKTTIDQVYMSFWSETEGAIIALYGVETIGGYGIQATIYHTSDGGETWTTAEGHPPIQSWHDISCAASFVSADVGMVSFRYFSFDPYEPNAYLTVDGGRTWNKLVFDSLDTYDVRYAEAEAMYRNGNKLVIPIELKGGYGFAYVFYVSSDEGQTWKIGDLYDAGIVGSMPVE